MDEGTVNYATIVALSAGVVVGLAMLLLGSRLVRPQQQHRQPPHHPPRPRHDSRGVNRARVHAPSGISGPHRPRPRF
ncbi:MAG: hypothetical protein AAF842_02740, partial [Planctomycetota bacterium]